MAFLLRVVWLSRSMQPTIKALHVAVVSSPACCTVAVTRGGVASCPVFTDAPRPATIAVRALRTCVLASVPLPPRRAGTRSRAEVTACSVLACARLSAILAVGVIYKRNNIAMWLIDWLIDWLINQLIGRSLIVIDLIACHGMWTIISV